MTLTIDKVDAQEYDQRNTEEGICVLEKDALGPANSRIPVTICWPPSTLHRGPYSAVEAVVGGIHLNNQDF